MPDAHALGRALREAGYTTSGRGLGRRVAQLGVPFQVGTRLPVLIRLSVPTDRAPPGTLVAEVNGEVVATEAGPRKPFIRPGTLRHRSFRVGDELWDRLNKTSTNVSATIRAALVAWLDAGKT